MSPKVRNITGWVLTALLAALYLWSAFGKFTAGPEMQKMMEGLGLTADKAKIIGAIEVLSIVLFIIPRTGVLGTLLLASYMGGAIATHLEHGQPVIMPVIVAAVVWITALIRFPELGSRLMGSRGA